MNGLWTRCTGSSPGQGTALRLCLPAVTPGGWQHTPHGVAGRIKRVGTGLAQNKHEIYISPYYQIIIICNPFLLFFWMQKGTIYYFICSTNRCFLSVYHALGTVLCTGDMAVSKTDRYITCPQGTHIVNFVSFYFIFIKTLLIYNVVLVSAVQQSKSVICIHISIFRVFSHIGH